MTFPVPAPDVSADARSQGRQLLPCVRLTQVSFVINMTDSPESKSHSHINYLPDLTLQFKGQKELNFKNIALAHSKPRLVPIDSWLMHVMYGNNINNVLFRSSQQTQSTRNSLYSIPPPDFKFKPGVSGEKLLWSLKVGVFWCLSIKIYCFIVRK